ncbi:hypothetical protein TrST_g3627 [Triparma strigata]|uniref:TNFR-Cys domain-containing protein n=1 Tax=Triparma strigata TaxID=1606541 RepID=A0A9W7A1Q7_9STRA|nr:hypothetical protein TrST_g3627 [Triparma strigata]
MTGLCDVCSNGKYTNNFGLYSCTGCVAGKYDASSSASTSADCVFCPSGKFAEDPGASSSPAGKKPTSDRQGVESCTPGKYSTGAADTCADCASGKASDAGAAGCRTCATCGLGKYQTAECSPIEETQCEDCVAGKASFGGAVSECTTCSGDGKYSDTVGASNCKTASAGHKPKADSTSGLMTSEEQCGAGKYSTGAAEDCTSCGSGETSDAGAAGCRTCATCGLGKYQIAECTANSETQCEDCVAGKASMGGAVSECASCNGPGEYSEALASVCKIAPAGHKPNEGRSGINKCPKNTFSIGAADECSDCIDGGHSKEGESSCEKIREVGALKSRLSGPRRTLKIRELELGLLPIAPKLRKKQSKG